MNQRFIHFLCYSTLVGLLALPASAVAQQKTAKQCNDEWTANKAAIQASGKTKKDFVAGCRGAAKPASASTAAPPTTKAGEPKAIPGNTSAGQKTVKQCNDEWTAGKAAIRASGKIKKDFVAGCRSGAPSAQAPAKPPAWTTNATPDTTSTQPSSSSPPARPSTSVSKPPASTSRPDTAAPARPSPNTANREPPATAPARPPQPGTNLATGQFATEGEAKAYCPRDTVVWANLDSKIYHFSGARSYGTTKKGAYMCERDTAAAGIRATKNEKPPKT
jgi:hypothetical protein